MIKTNIFQNYPITPSLQSTYDPIFNAPPCILCTAKKIEPLWQLFNEHASLSLVGRYDADVLQHPLAFKVPAEMNAQCHDKVSFCRVVHRRPEYYTASI